jgi:hypothetical protein
MKYLEVMKIFNYYYKHSQKYFHLDKFPICIKEKQRAKWMTSQEKGEDNICKDY